MKHIYQTIFVIIMLYMFTDIGHTQNLGDLYDAVFSPDGIKIGVGAETGFYIIDRHSHELEFSLKTPNGVHFIRWSQNGEKVFLSLWSIEQEVIDPIYWIYDLSLKTLLYEINEDIRWFYSYHRPVTVPGTFPMGSIIYPDRSCAHPNVLRFSADSNRLIWITMNNQIMEYDMSTNEQQLIISEFKDEEYIVSIGYLNNPDLIWIGTLYEQKPENYEKYPNEKPHSKMIIFQKSNGEYQRFDEQLYDDKLYGLVFDTSSDDNVLLMIYAGFIAYPGGYFSMDHYIYSILSGKKVSCTKRGGGIGIASAYRHRSIIVNEKSIVKSLTVSGIIYSEDDEYRRESIISREFNTETMTQTKESDWIEDRDFGGFLLQPFSPDGEEFLHIRDGKLYLYKTNTFEGEQILPKQSAVSSYECQK